LQDESILHSQHIWDLVQYFDYVLLPQRFERQDRIVEGTRRSEVTYVIKEWTEADEELGDSLWSALSDHNVMKHFDEVHKGLSLRVNNQLNKIDISELIIYLTERAHWSRKIIREVDWSKQLESFQSLDVNWFWMWVWRHVTGTKTQQIESADTLELVNTYEKLYASHFYEYLNSVQTLTHTSDIDVVYDTLLLFYRSIPTWRAERLTLDPLDQIVDQNAQYVTGSKQQILAMRALARVRNLQKQQGRSDKMKTLENNFKIIDAYDSIHRLRDRNASLQKFKDSKSAQGYLEYAKLYLLINKIRLYSTILITIWDYRELQTIVENLKKHENEKNISENAQLKSAYDNIMHEIHFEYLEPRLSHSTAIIKAMAQGIRSRKDLNSKKHAVNIIVARYRMVLARRELERRMQERRSVIIIQSSYRRLKAQIEAQKLREEQRERVVMMQSWIRRKLHQSYYLHFRQSVTTLQSIARMKMARARLIRTRYNVIIMQVQVRGFLARRRVAKLRQEKLELESVIVIQKLSRASLARKQTAKIRQERQKILELTLKIQSLFRANQARKAAEQILERRRSAVIVIQIMIRSFQAQQTRIRLQEEKRIQEEKQAMKEQQEREEAVIAIQAVARAKKVFEHFQRKLLDETQLRFFLDLRRQQAFFIYFTKWKKLAILQRSNFLLQAQLEEFLNMRSKQTLHMYLRDWKEHYMFRKEQRLQEEEEKRLKSELEKEERRRGEKEERERRKREKELLIKQQEEQEEKTKLAQQELQRVLAIQKNKVEQSIERDRLAKTPATPEAKPAPPLEEYGDIPDEQVPTAKKELHIEIDQDDLNKAIITEDQETKSEEKREENRDEPEQKDISEVPVRQPTPKTSPKVTKLHDVHCAIERHTITADIELGSNVFVKEEKQKKKGKIQQKQLKFCTDGKLFMDAGKIAFTSIGTTVNFSIKSDLKTVNVAIKQGKKKASGSPKGSPKSFVSRSSSPRSPRVSPTSAKNPGAVEDPITEEMPIDKGTVYDIIFKFKKKAEKKNWQDIHIIEISISGSPAVSSAIEYCKHTIANENQSTIL
jgi:hypothetical protein